MPRIPTYDTPQVQTNAIQPARANPGIASLAGAGEEALGKGLMAVSDYAAKVKDEADTMRAEEAFNKLREKQNQLGYGQEGAFNVKGGNVFNREKPFSQDYMGRLDTETQTIMQGLANDNQKRIFERAASRAKMEFGGQLSKHEAVEGAAYRESVFKGVLESEREHVTRNFNDPDSVAQSIQRVQANTRSYSMQQGLGADQQEMAVKEAVSGLHMTVIDRMLTGDKDRGIAADPMGAKKYYEDQVKAGAIVESSKEAARMRDNIAKEERLFVASTAVDETMKVFGIDPNDDTVTINKDQMVSYLRDKYKDDPEGFKIARVDLEDRLDIAVESRKNRNHARFGGVYKMAIENKSLSEIKGSSYFKDLDQTAQNEVLQNIMEMRKPKGGSGGGGGDGAGGGKLDKFADYWTYSSNPQLLSRMSEEQIFAMAPRIGASNVQKLVKERHNLLNGDGNVAAATIDADQFKHWARQGGLNPSATKGQDAEVVGELKYRVETIIDQQQRDKKRALSRTEKDEIMQKLVMQVPLRVNNRILPGTSVESRRLFEVKDIRNIVIPDAERSKVIARLKAEGVTNPSQEDIVDKWVKTKALQGTR